MTAPGTPGVTVKVWLAPQSTRMVPDGTIVQPGVAAAVIGYCGALAKLAVIVWDVKMPVKTKLDTAPFETPSTTTSTIR